MMPRAVILGCGPAGLLAAHAAVTSGMFGEIDIYSRKIKSTLYGAQYMHEYIPLLDMGDSTEVDQKLIVGSAHDYAKKVYAELYNPLAVNSATAFDGVTLAWDIRYMYDELWRRYSDLIADLVVDGAAMAALIDKLRQGGNTHVFSTIPRNATCIEPSHRFEFKYIWAAGETVQRKLDGFDIPDNKILLNAGEAPRWYRLSQVFGMKTVEWPDSKQKPPVEGVAHVSKPLSTTCDCWMRESVHFLGRYGKWQKGVLAHTAYFETANIIHELYKQGILV